jgi:hypothetical protein
MQSHVSSLGGIRVRRLANHGGGYHGANPASLFVEMLSGESIVSAKTTAAPDFPAAGDFPRTAGSALLSFPSACPPRAGGGG